MEGFRLPPRSYKHRSSKPPLLYTCADKERAMQKTILGGVLILSALSAHPQTNRNTAPAIYIGAADIQATLKKAPADSVTDQAIRTVAVGNLNVGVGVVHRSAKAAQNSVAHDEFTEIYHILAGSGTLVTGGTLTKPERFPVDSQTVKELAGASGRGTGRDKCL